MINLIKDQQLGRFIKSIQENPLPIEGQRSIGKGKDLFVEDWLEIELAKFFYLGIDIYKRDPIPRRLSHNNSFNIEMIIKRALTKIELYHYIERNKDQFDGIVIYKSGRGLDIILANAIRKWKKIFCFDEDGRYGPLIHRFFGMNISFTTIPFEVSKMGGGNAIIRNEGL